MKSKLKSIFEKSAYWTGVIAIGLIVGLSIQFARAWVNPTNIPPGGNVGAPINTGTISQFKSGVIRALGLQTPNLRVEPAAGVNPTGKFLAAGNASGDITYANGGGGMEIIEADGPYQGKTGREACAAIGKGCVKVVSHNYVYNTPNCQFAGNGPLACTSSNNSSRTCAVSYNNNLNGVDNGTHDNMHSCDARIGNYTTYLSGGMLQCMAYFSAICS